MVIVCLKIFSIFFYSPLTLSSTAPQILPHLCLLVKRVRQDFQKYFRYPLPERDLPMNNSTVIIADSTSRAFSGVGILPQRPPRDGRLNPSSHPGGCVARILFCISRIRFLRAASFSAYSARSARDTAWDSSKDNRLSSLLRWDWDCWDGRCDVSLRCGTPLLSTATTKLSPVVFVP